MLSTATIERFDVKDTNGREYTITAADPIAACERIADLHGVTVVAWRRPPTTVAVVHPSQVDG